MLFRSGAASVIRIVRRRSHLDHECEPPPFRRVDHQTPRAWLCRERRLRCDAHAFGLDFVVGVHWRVGAGSLAFPARASDHPTRPPRRSRPLHERGSDCLARDSVTMTTTPNNSLQTTADGAFNLTIESLVFKCRSSAVFEVGRWTSTPRL